MAKPSIEVCLIRQVSDDTDAGFLGLGMRVYRQHYAAYAGDKLLGKSDQWEIRSSDFGGSASSQVKAEERANKLREAAYQQVFRGLVAEGWEPVGTDRDGRFMSFQRSSGSALRPTDFVAELERLSQLRKHGSLTDSEFEAAKKRLLR